MSDYFKSASFRNDLMGAIGLVFLIIAVTIFLVGFVPQR